MYAILVMQLHYPPNYVLDEMEMYEVRAAIKYGYYAYKDIWEANRLTAYIVAQTNAKHHIELTDIVEFPWEKKKDKDDDTKITKQQIEYLKIKANNYIKSKQNG